MVTGWMAKAAW